MLEAGVSKMGDSKLQGPVAPAEWDMPEPVSDLGSADKSFNDDQVAARLKTEEAARLRQNQERFGIEQPKRVITEHEKIEQAGASRTAQDDDVARRARLLDTEAP